MTLTELQESILLDLEGLAAILKTIQSAAQDNTVVAQLADKAYLELSQIVPDIQRSWEPQ